MQTDVKPLLKIGGIPIKVSDIRGVFGQQILLANGMKIHVTRDELRLVQAGLTKVAKNILNETRRTGKL